MPFPPSQLFFFCRASRTHFHHNNFHADFPNSSCFISFNVLVHVLVLIHCATFTPLPFLSYPLPIPSLFLSSPPLLSFFLYRSLFPLSYPNPNLRVNTFFNFSFLCMLCHTFFYIISNAIFTQFQSHRFYIM